MGCTKSKPVASGSQVTVSELRPNDLVFFSGKASSALENTWIHIGMVVYLPNLYPQAGQMLLEYASEYTDNLENCLLQKSSESGLRLVDLNQRIQSSDAAHIGARRFEYTRADFLTQTATEQTIFEELHNFLQRQIPSLAASYSPYPISPALSSANLPGRILERTDKISSKTRQIFDSQPIKKLALAKVEKFAPLATIK